MGNITFVREVIMSLTSYWDSLETNEIIRAIVRFQMNKLNFGNEINVTKYYVHGNNDA